MASLFGPGGIDNSFHDLLISAATTQQRPQVPLGVAEETRPHTPLRRHPDAVACTTEWLGHWCDHADSTGRSISESPVL